MSELRTIDGLTVENRCRKVGHITVSEYRLVPKDLLELAG